MAAGRHILEGEDQLVILIASDVMHIDPCSKLDVFSVGTNIFVLSPGHYPMLPKSTTLLKRKVEKISIQESYLRLGQQRAEALIGWYADNTGSFAGNCVVSHSKAFLEPDGNILDAFTIFGESSEMPDWTLDQKKRH